MEGHARNLARHGLVEQRTIEGHSSYSTKVLTLTKDGQRLLERAQLVSNRQTTYHGFVKPKEARHDADVYRLYQKVAKEIERSGGKVRRVVLDFELKKDLYKKLSRMQPDKDPRYERIFIANQFDLKVVDGKLPIPDLRIEYEDDCRDVHCLDLEIATCDYRPQGLSEKTKAGFHMFARQQDHAKLRPFSTLRKSARRSSPYEIPANSYGGAPVFRIFGRGVQNQGTAALPCTRLIALDFILRNQDFTFLESEEQKLVFFCDQMGIDKKILPHKRYAGAIKDQHTDRYFVDKFTMFYNPSFALPPVVTFSFIDPGFKSMDSFKTHLNAYMTLFTRLPKPRLYYVATKDTNFKQAKKIFQGVFHRLWDPDSPSGLLDYFRTRRTWDDKQ